jgi:hypothetical protein
MGAADQSARGVDRHRLELRREATHMSLYVCIVFLAGLAVLPDDYGVTAGESGHGPPLLALVWGTAVGLSLAHWFAFQLTALELRGGRLHRDDLELAVAQVAGAGFVALATTVPILLVDDPAQVDAAVFAPAAIIGVAGYSIARTAGRSRGVSVLLGALVLVVGVAIAAAKAFLLGH